MSLPTPARASVEPTLEVVSFGVADGDVHAEAARSGPLDFVFARVARPPLPGRSFNGPITVAQNDTWQTILSRFQVSDGAFAEALSHAAARDWPTRPVRDSRVWIELGVALNPLAVYYSLSPRQMVMGRWINGAIEVDQATRAGDVSAVAASASGELYRAADQLGMPESIVDQLVNVFSGQLDFHRDLMHGFKGTVMFEMFFEPNRAPRAGRILAARLITANRTDTAYYFEDGNGGEFPYFSADGTSAHRSFLQSPILFSRITSGYSVARFHPILHTWRAHTGIDFAAPIGTPVRATADGRVAFAGVRGEYGNLVQVQHRDGLVTYYGHMQGFNAGIASGVVLHQGDTLGRVGMTGMATGPHLHYELRKDGKPFDPLLFKDTTVKLPDNQLERFDHLVQWYEKQLSASYRSRFVVP